jgi:hypothetical protein
MATSVLILRKTVILISNIQRKKYHFVIRLKIRYNYALTI